MQNHDFKINYSCSYSIFLLLLISASNLIIIFQPLNLTIKLFLVILCTLYGFYIFWRSHSILSLHYQSDNTWKAQTKKERFAAEILGNSTVTAFIMILRLQHNVTGKTFSAIILRDSVEDYRKLYVMVKPF